MLTLWAKDNDLNYFNRKKNVGLHHLALAIAKEEDLGSIYSNFVKKY